MHCVFHLSPHAPSNCIKFLVEIKYFQLEYREKYTIFLGFLNYGSMLS